MSRKNWFFPKLVDIVKKLLYGIVILFYLGGNEVDELVKSLDKNLEYINYKIKDETIYIYVKSNRVKC
ncbi:hypothetical protein [Maledivibacter halophilus]|uniref:hypothetical protein n=1 Tax=Maledivibacter halophilus TaxID=36842 RepID=UPI0011164D46|nr:hypothetical protein [Maledivibacter halophilus]